MASAGLQHSKHNPLCSRVRYTCLLLTIVLFGILIHVVFPVAVACYAVGHLGQQAAWPLKSKAAMLLAAVTRQQGPETYSALLPQLVASAAEGPMQVGVLHAGERGRELGRDVWCGVLRVRWAGWCKGDGCILALRYAATRVSCSS